LGFADVVDQLIEHSCPSLGPIQRCAVEPSELTFFMAQLRFEYRQESLAIWRLCESGQECQVFCGQHHSAGIVKPCPASSIAKQRPCGHLSGALGICSCDCSLAFPLFALDARLLTHGIDRGFGSNESRAQPIGIGE
jgi:hypothetical protein